LTTVKKTIIEQQKKTISDVHIRYKVLARFTFVRSGILITIVTTISVEATTTTTLRRSISSSKGSKESKYMYSCAAVGDLVPAAKKRRVSSVEPETVELNKRMRIKAVVVVRCSIQTRKKKKKKE
jgi:hypothetical protein